MIDWTKMQTADAMSAEAARVAAEAQVAASLAYLAETDWMVIRAAEGGAALPDDVRQARQAARDVVSALR